MSYLSQKLKDIERRQAELEIETRELMENATVTDEMLSETLKRIFPGDRYVLIRPDGWPYWDVPFFRPYPGTSWQQRPAALKAARNIPGCRVYDQRERKVVTE